MMSKGQHDVGNHRLNGKNRRMSQALPEILVGKYLFVGFQTGKLQLQPGDRFLKGHSKSADQGKPVQDNEIQKNRQNEKCSGNGQFLSVCSGAKLHCFYRANN